MYLISHDTFHLSPASAATTENPKIFNFLTFEFVKTLTKGVFNFAIIAIRSLTRSVQSTLFWSSPEGTNYDIHMDIATYRLNRSKGKYSGGKNRIAPSITDPPLLTLPLTLILLVVQTSEKNSSRGKIHLYAIPSITSSYLFNQFRWILNCLKFGVFF